VAEIEKRLEALEAEVSELRAINDIQQLRFEYWFSLLDKDVERLVNCFTEDVFLDYGFGIELTGVDAIREFFNKLLEPDDLIRQVPRGSNPQIKLLSEDRAEGRWLVEVVALRKSQQDGRRIGVQYFEKYRKTEAGWKLCEMKNDYLSFEGFERRQSP
jgi:hypothetical protein